MLLFLVHDYFRKDQGKRALLLCRLSRFYQRKIKQETGKKNRKEMRIVFWPVTHLIVWNERKISAFYGKTRDSFPSMSLPRRTRKRLKRFMSNFLQWYALEKYHCKLCYLRDTDKMDFLKATSLSMSAHVSGCTLQTRFSHAAIAWQDAWQLVLQGSNFLESKIEMFENQAKKCYCSMACPSL